MKLEILLPLLAAAIVSTAAAAAAAAAERISHTDQLPDNVKIRQERSIALIELSRRRKRNSSFQRSRYCCDAIPMSCCLCCQQSSSTTTTARTRTTVPSIRGTTTEGEIPVMPPTKPHITILGSKNFTETVINSEEYWIVIFTFSGPACFFCFQLIPIIEETRDLLTGYPNVHLGIFDGNYGDHKTHLIKIGITEFPTVYIYANDKEHPYDYGRPKTAKELINSTLYLITRPKVAVGRCAIESKPFPTSDVYELIDSNFQETVESCTEVWVVHFYLTWPDVCKSFFSVFEEAAKELKGRVKFGAFFQSKRATTPATYGASTKACWVKMFPKGETGPCVLDFNEGQHSPELDQTLVSWVEKYLDEEAVQKVCGAETTTSSDESETEPEETTPQPTPSPKPPTTTRRPTTTTTQSPTTTSTRRPITTTRRSTTTTTIRPTTSSTTRRRTTTTIPMLRSTTSRPRPTTTTSTTPVPPTRRITTAMVVDRPGTFPPGTPTEELPKTDVNQEWCRYSCCIVYFLPQQTRCELTCYKNYITTLERASTRQSTGCALYFEYQGQRPDFERTFAVFQFPRILVVTTETHMFTTRDGTVSEAVLDQYIQAYVEGKLQMKRIPAYVAPPCESEAC